MAGANPYINKPKTEPAKTPFQITFVIEETGEEKVFVIDPKQASFGRIGLEGSVLDIAEGVGIEIDHACGGVCACATCHVKVTEGRASCSQATEDEEDQLDSARDVDTDSRLSCQCVPNGTQNLRVVIPAWNKNLAREGH